MQAMADRTYTTTLRVLLVGSGVIGSIFGGQIALAGHQLWVLAHRDRERGIASQGIRLRDVSTGLNETAKIQLAQTAEERQYDLVLVAVQATQLASTFPALRTLRGKPHIIFLGNNPEGYVVIPKDIPGTVELAFPGVSGSFNDGVVQYTQIAQQPTTLETNSSPASKILQATLEARGFSVKRTEHMDGWLKYHAVFISCISMALLKANVNTTRLGNDKEQLKLMCQAIEEGFRALKKQGIRGLPPNLALLHSPLLRFVAIWYWGHIMRSSKGELYFAAHIRHAPGEAQALVKWVRKQVAHSPQTEHLLKLTAK